mmetsp:Transcript_10524/g.25745  ORF Transcript_10524/g.25745 Transcript_10524/m.25745 type:complete len:503 (+) Transcript_10524:168-1676(+)|eukprot:CAMPEP_0197589462 /NCGR_PEP_ID=MMETSP1326-20131121/10397_1 /TAXON_ID=1155430 /ORGANISM="Genus nov. species nov., Strain RCC2288" /LENGTH=502 /DNA_ID=CAMNT_0043154399 /DNA_START=168 /DNA_END=1676 /DNA_ORIENTATION=-
MSLLWKSWLKKGDGTKVEWHDIKDDFVLRNAHVPECTVSGAVVDLKVDGDGLAFVDIVIRDRKIVAIVPAAAGGRRLEHPSESVAADDLLVLDLDGGMCWPTFCDVHTHIDKGHTCERSRNMSGSLAGADDSCAKDEGLWNKDDVYRRMDFSLQTAYAHGTSAIRTHIMSGPVQGPIAWPVFDELREAWKGRMELQGVSLSILAFFRDEVAAAELADQVKAHGGVLGAAVSCTDRGGTADDIWTTCGEEMPALLDVIFRLANERELDLDFHVDENGNECSKGLLHIAKAAIRSNYKGKLVCGHCCSLAAQPPDELQRIFAACRTAGVTVVSLPIVNQWLQNRDTRGLCTPKKRGVTMLKELDEAGVPTCLASDNTRDQFYGYGDLDMLEIFRESCRIAHLDRPIGQWPLAVTARPAQIMRLSEHHGRIAVGGKADLVAFRGRVYSELLSRPQHDRLVIRDGRPCSVDVPDYRVLDDHGTVNGKKTSGGSSVGGVKKRGRDDA